MMQVRLAISKPTACQKFLNNWGRVKLNLMPSGFMLLDPNYHLNFSSLYLKIYKDTNMRIFPCIRL